MDCGKIRFSHAAKGYEGSEYFAVLDLVNGPFPGHIGLVCAFYKPALFKYCAYKGNAAVGEYAFVCSLYLKYLHNAS